MGTDVRLYVVGEPTPEQLRAADVLVRERSEIAGWNDQDATLSFAPERIWGEPRVEFRTLSRHFGPGGGHGLWPDIEIAITAMGEAFPGWPLFYGPDDQYSGELVDEDLLEGCRAAWREVELQRLR